MARGPGPAVDEAPSLRPVWKSSLAELAQAISLELDARRPRAAAAARAPRRRPRRRARTRAVEWRGLYAVYARRLALAARAARLVGGAELGALGGALRLPQPLLEQLTRRRRRAVRGPPEARASCAARPAPKQRALQRAAKRAAATQCAPVRMPPPPAAPTQAAAIIGVWLARRALFKRAPSPLCAGTASTRRGAR